MKLPVSMIKLIVIIMKLLVIIMKLLDNWDENTSHD